MKLRGLPHRYRVVALVLGVFLALMATSREPDRNLPVSAVTVALVVVTVYTATYIVWRVQSRRRGEV